MEGPEKVDEATPIEINSESKVAKGGLKNSLRNAKKPLGYCARFFQSLFVRLLYSVGFMVLMDGFYPLEKLYKNERSSREDGLPTDRASHQTYAMIENVIYFFLIILFVEFIYNVKWKKCTDDGFISPTVCLIIGFVNVLVTGLPFLIGFQEDAFDGAIEKGLNRPLIPHTANGNDDHTEKIIIFVLLLIFCKFITPRKSNTSSREVSMLPIIQIGMAMDAFEFFDIDTAKMQDKEGQKASRLIEIIWSLSLIQFVFDPTHTIEVELEKDENGNPVPSAYCRFKQFIFDDVSLITAVIFQEIPYLWWRLTYGEYLESSANTFKNIGVVYFTLRRMFIYVLDEDNSGSITFGDFQKAWKKGGFVKNFTIFVIGIVVLLILTPVIIIVVYAYMA